ncbi:MAG: DUF885 domain-containing protein [Clostridiales bacterium]|nr:DUF885 domain-containing protein [Clostridiales bacterium]
MRELQIRLTSRILVLILLVSLLAGGCAPRRPEPTTTTAAAYSQGSSDGYEHYEEQQMLEQRRFSEWEQELFLEEISASQLDLHFLFKDPAALGIEKADALYPSLSEETRNQNIKDRQQLEEDLDSFDLNLLNDNQRCTLRVLKSYLDTEKLADGLELYAQPLAVTIGTQAQLPILLAEYAFYDPDDVEDYLALLGGIDDYYTQILAFEKEKSAAGLMMSDTTIDHIIESCESYLLVPGDNFLIDTFDSRLDTLTGLTEEEKDDYREKNKALIESDFIPAYQLLIDGLRELKGTGTNPGGQSGYPQGREYYEYLVYSATGTSYTSIEDLLEAMENCMDNALSDISRILSEQPELADEIDSYAFRQTEAADIMEELKVLTKEDYPELPECSYTFKDVPEALQLSLSPAFYLVSPIDDYQNNVIYLNHNPDYSSNDLYTVIAHEGYPGHLYQNVYFHTHCDSLLRMILSFPGYSEGWATYVEQAAYQLDNGLQPQMGALLSANYIATLGLSACLDVYINYYGWNRDQVRDYLKNFNSNPEEIADSIYQTMIETPSNYLSYYVGYMEFLNMENTARKQLGNRFDLKSFHTFLLDIGSAPFDVIQPYFTSWLQAQQLGQ